MSTNPSPPPEAPVRQGHVDKPAVTNVLAEVDVTAAHAMFIAERIDLRRLAGNGRLGDRPLMLPVGRNGVAALFRYGVVVTFGANAEEESAVLADVAPFVSGTYSMPESETLTLRRKPDGDPTIEAGVVSLRDFDIERLQLVAVMLSRSVVLAEYEASVAKNFDLIEPFAVELQSRGRGGKRMTRLLQHIGRVLLTEHKMVSRVEVNEKPELLWEHPELEPLYLRLENEFEISERSAALERKLALAARTVTTVQELLQSRRTLRVEWYIVILIVLEIMLTTYELFGRG